MFAKTQTQPNVKLIFFFFTNKKFKSTKYSVFGHKSSHLIDDYVSDEQLINYLILQLTIDNWFTIEVELQFTIILEYFHS